MKKLLNIGAIIFLLALQSCEEKGIIINGPKTYVDTTYIATPETPQPRNVFIEEFTGASCTNCPAGHLAVANLVATNPGRIVAVAYHTFNGGSIFKPVFEIDSKSAYDFRDSNATEIGTTIFGGVSSIPVAGIDRIKVGTSLQIPRNNWASETSKRLSDLSSANINLTSAYDATENKVTISIKIAYTKDVIGKNSLNIGVVENGIIDLQKFPDSVDHHYDHEHIFRRCLTAAIGNPVLDAIPTKQAGRVYEYNYSFTPSNSWKLENCYIVAALCYSESDNKETIQAAQVKLK